MNPQPTIFVVDDDPSVRRAVSRLLRAEGLNVLSFDSAEGFLDTYDPSMYGCIVLDVAMPGLGGLELQEKLLAGGSSPPIVFLTGRGDIPMSVRAMKQGAADFLTKPVQSAKLLSAVRAAVLRDRQVQQLRAEEHDHRRKLATLTAREFEVLQHVVSGKLNKQTAADLGTVEKTIKVHRARIMEKLAVKSVAELVRLVERAGIAAAER